MYRDVPSKVKGKLLHLAPPSTQKEALHLVGLYGLWRKHIPPLLDVLLRSICQVTRKTATLEWGLEQEKALQQIQASRPLGLNDPVDPMVLEVLVEDRDAVWESLAGLHRGITVEAAEIVE